nr:reverse transcriptase domain-containing protein [Tanacetum cinerariifolium]
MMASLLQMNTASTSGSGTLLGNTIANPKGELKAITTRSGLVIKGPIVPNPPKSVNPEEDECVEETYMDPDHAEYNIKVPPPPSVQKPKPPIQRNFVLHTRDSFPSRILYPSRMLKQKQQEKDEIQIQKFWNMFKQLHLNITLAEALMTLELANRGICTPDEIARDVFVPIGKFTFLADFVVVDYESDPRVPLILGRPFLRIARALIDVHGEEMILRCAEAIVVPPILAEQFAVKHSLINMMTSEQFFGLEKDNPHDHGQPAGGLKKNPRVQSPLGMILSQNSLTNSFLPPEPRTFVMKSRISSRNSMNLFMRPGKDIKISFVRVPHHGFTELHQLDTFYNALNPADQDSLNAAVGDNLLEKSPQDALTIIENKSKQTSAVTTAMTAMLKQFQSNPPPAQVKAVKEICVTCGGAHPYYQCLAAGGNTFLEFQDNIQDMVKNELRNEMKTSIQTSLSNQTNEIKNMMASLLQMNTASTLGSGTLLGNTIANPKSKLKAITTRSGPVTEGPTVPNPPKSVNPEEDECVEETYTDPDHAEYNIKVPPPHSVQKPKPPIQRNFVLHTRDSLPPRIPYPSRMLKQKQQEKDEIQIQKFWNMFKQLHLNITLVEAVVLMPKYQKMLKALLSNKEKLQKLANTPLNKNCSTVIFKKLPEKPGDPGKFLILCRFSELKCKALADLGASINLMPLSVWKKLGLSDLISTQMTLELANRAICTPDGIARDVFVPVGKFTFPADFVIVDYESDPRVSLILGRPFLRTARALIDVYGEEMILRDGDERTRVLGMNEDSDREWCVSWKMAEKEGKKGFVFGRETLKKRKNGVCVWAGNTANNLPNCRDMNLTLLERGCNIGNVPALKQLALKDEHGFVIPLGSRLH